MAQGARAGAGPQATCACGSPFQEAAPRPWRAGSHLRHAYAPAAAAPAPAGAAGRACCPCPPPPRLPHLLLHLRAGAGGCSKQLCHHGGRRLCCRHAHRLAAQPSVGGRCRRGHVPAGTCGSRVSAASAWAGSQPEQQLAPPAAWQGAGVTGPACPQCSAALTPPAPLPLGLPVLCIVDADAAPANLVTVQVPVSALCCCHVEKLAEAEALGSAGVPVRDQPAGHTPPQQAGIAAHATPPAWQRGRRLGQPSTDRPRPLPVASGPRPEGARRCERCAAARSPEGFDGARRLKQRLQLIFCDLKRQVAHCMHTGRWLSSQITCAHAGAGSTPAHRRWWMWASSWRRAPPLAPREISQIESSRTLDARVALQLQQLLPGHAGELQARGPGGRLTRGRGAAGRLRVAAGSGGHG
jgi:hypothetical protein